MYKDQGSGVRNSIADCRFLISDAILQSEVICEYHLLTNSSI